MYTKQKFIDLLCPSEVEIKKTAHGGTEPSAKERNRLLMMKDAHSRCYDLAVIGSGPAGLAGAFFASARGKKVLLVEKEKRFGGKLPLSGGGRCNVTNVLSAEEQARAFGSSSRFLLPALRNFPPEKTRGFFNGLGVEIEVTDGFHCFPCSGKAQDLVNALLSGCQMQGVHCLSGTRAEELLFDGEQIRGIRCGGEEFCASSVLLACGGKSYPKWCGSEGGYLLARQAGHTVTPLYPAMTGLQCVESWPGECAGISLEDVTCAIDLPGEKMRCRGELLFTHQGISAFAVLDLAGRTAQLLEAHESVPLKLNLFAELSPEAWQERFRNWRQEKGKTPAGKLLCAFLPKRLVPHLVPEAETPWGRYPGGAARQLLKNLTALQLHARDTENWHKAMVTKGGVALDEVNMKTLESRLKKGLYFAGELLDLDGPCGGYNIQWALSSGALCGKSV